MARAAVNPSLCLQTSLPEARTNTFDLAPEHTPADIPVGSAYQFTCRVCCTETKGCFGLSPDNEFLLREFLTQCAFIRANGEPSLYTLIECVGGLSYHAGQMSANR